MATWHQMRRPVRLYHDTKWSIVTDPPGGFCTSMLFATEREAREVLALWEAKGGKHSYILPPSNAR